MRCTDCKEQPEPGRKRCMSCVKKRNAYAKQYRLQWYRQGKCTVCGGVRGFDRFSKKTCVDCASHAPMEAKARLAKKYGLTLVQLEGLEKLQAGNCSLCGLPFTKKYVIDHCHKVGIVRGLVHQSCNIAIGHYELKGRKKFVEQVEAYLLRAYLGEPA